MIERICSLLKIRKPNVSGCGVLIAAGDTVPSDGSYGFEKACLFQHVKATDTRVLYVNKGTKESCAFVPVQITSA